MLDNDITENMGQKYGRQTSGKQEKKKRKRDEGSHKERSTEPEQ